MDMDNRPLYAHPPCLVSCFVTPLSLCLPGRARSQTLPVGGTHTPLIKLPMILGVQVAGAGRKFETCVTPGAAVLRPD
jgi:hypothetical protein